MAAASPSAAASRSTSCAGTIVERALALQTNIIDKRLERSRLKIDHFLSESGLAAYYPDDPCRDLR